MKATIEFDLSDPDERMEHLRCVKSLGMALILWEIVHNLRKECHRHIDRAKDLDNYDAVDMVLDKISELLNDNGIIIDDLTC